MAVRNSSMVEQLLSQQSVWASKPAFDEKAKTAPVMGDQVA